MITAQKAQPPSYIQAEWQRGYESQPHEYSYWVDEIDGQIPTELRGTLFRNGPGLLDIAGTPIRHPFDGDGMVCAFTFENGHVHFQNRFVQTEGYQQEKAAGKSLYRGVFGTRKSGGWLNNLFDLKFKNIANTNVVYWGKQLLALWEGAEPHRLDPYNLHTLGVDYLNGVIQPGEAFAAHPRIDYSCHLDGGNPCLVNFGLKVGLASTINVFEFSPEGDLLRRYHYTTPGFSFIHDFAITPNYCIFFQSQVTYNPLPFLFGLRGAGECIQFHPQKPTRIILIPRTPPHQEVKVLETPAGFVFHHANAFEAEQSIYIDSVCYASIPQVNPNSNYKETNFAELDPGQLWRFAVDLEQAQVKRTLLESQCCEFPSINPRNVGQAYRYLYLGAAASAEGNAPLQALLKRDLITGDRQFYAFAPHGYVGEPVFVPKPQGKEEDEGWLMTMVYDGSQHRSALAIFDAQRVSNGPIAIAYLQHHIPYGLHGFWTEECFVKRSSGVQI